MAEFVLSRRIFPGDGNSDRNFIFPPERFAFCQAQYRKVDGRYPIAFAAPAYGELAQPFGRCGPRSLGSDRPSGDEPRGGQRSCPWVLPAPSARRSRLRHFILNLDRPPAISVSGPTMPNIAALRRPHPCSLPACRPQRKSRASPRAKEEPAGAGVASQMVKEKGRKAQSPRPSGLAQCQPGTARTAAKRPARKPET